MELDKIKIINEMIGLEVSKSLEEIGTINMRILCDLRGLCTQLEKRLENPDKTIKQDKLHNSKIFK